MAPGYRRGRPEPEVVLPARLPEHPEAKQRGGGAGEWEGERGRGACSALWRREASSVRRLPLLSVEPEDTQLGSGAAAAPRTCWLRGPLGAPRREPGRREGAEPAAGRASRGLGAPACAAGPLRAEDGAASHARARPRAGPHALLLPGPPRRPTSRPGPSTAWGPRNGVYSVTAAEGAALSSERRRGVGSGENLRTQVSEDAPDQLPAAVRAGACPPSPGPAFLPRMVLGERAASWRHPCRGTGPGPAPAARSVLLAAQTLPDAAHTEAASRDVRQLAALLVSVTSL